MAPVFIYASEVLTEGGYSTAQRTRDSVVNWSYEPSGIVVAPGVAMCLTHDGCRTWSRSLQITGAITEAPLLRFAEHRLTEGQRVRIVGEAIDWTEPPELAVRLISAHETSGGDRCGGVAPDVVVTWAMAMLGAPNDFRDDLEPVAPLAPP